MRHTGLGFFEIGSLSKTIVAAIVANVTQQRAKASRWTTDQVYCAIFAAVIDASMVVETWRDQVVTWHCGEEVQSLYRALLKV